MRVLVADLDTTFRSYVTSSLGTLSGVSAVETSEPPRWSDPGVGVDLVFLDFGLIPAIEDPIEWLRVISQIAPPIFIVGDTRDEQLALDVEAAGAVGYVARDDVDAPRLIEIAQSTLRQVGRPAPQYKATPPASNAIEIEGYRIVQTIAGGGNATVYLAECDRIGASQVVLKVMHGVSGRAYAETLERFEREYRIVADLGKRNIAKIFECHIDPQPAYLAIEYFPRGDLRTRMRRPISVKDAVRFAMEIAEALREIHAVNVLHRDLKPGNLMLREDDSLALIDFGLAKAQDHTALTGTGELHGTPFYISPEQLTTGDVDERSDLYSLGIIFYEMLTGQPPYQARQVFEVLSMHVRSPIPPLPIELRALQPVLDKLLAKDPAARVTTADQALRLLECVSLR